MPLCTALAQQGRIAQLMGSDESLYPLKVMEITDHLPFTLIMHGREDSACPVDGSYKFNEAATKKYGESSVVLIVELGDHFFDFETPLDTPWLKKRTGPSHSPMAELNSQYYLS
jgi:hypothetical protein